MKRVLLIDDDNSLSRTLITSLSARDFHVMRSPTGEIGMVMANTEQFDVVILDLGLPKMDGMAVLKEIRKISAVPIVVLSARELEAGKVEALERGADDYVTKPFGIDELVARLRAAIRRGVRSDGQTIIESKGLRIDLDSKVITSNGNDVRLTATEWRVLEVLVGQENSLVTHEALLSAVWGAASGAPIEYSRVYVASLRRKIEVDPANPRHILTDPGQGYRFIRTAS